MDILTLVNGIQSGCGPVPDQTRALTAFPALLDRRARNRTIGAKHTAIAGEGLESLAAALAIVEELAGVSGHGLN
jgi:hypothetical protein